MSDSVLFAAHNRPDAAAQLLFMHHAGGSSYSYMQLAQKMSDSIEVFCLELAGRGSRFLDPLTADAEVTLGEIMNAIERLGLGRHKPLMICGHSLGAELAYQTAHRLRREAPEMRLGVMLSARGYIDPIDLRGRPRESLSDDDILRLLEQYEGTPPEVLADPELRAYVIGVMRNDLTLLAALAGMPKPPLDVQAYIAGGDCDSRVPVPRLAGWGRAFAAPLTQRVFTGGHFYLFADTNVVPWIEAQVGELAQLQAQPLSLGELPESAAMNWGDRI
ncbi:alpha/beta fold hydrolase [Hahella aquimaris]|uniref:thioesterase II family protein n=1 Tax=Hahella sp. HNIBRBA332 TaxID=3015983 RepID=UPI00273B2723|nr:alpha/beta fold hydrolase [Hahella sp. HNIBRBA332]WLQ16383.1 alpha/beta fold hydrolase [Hahella sp. HNIBRBA332]